MITSLVLVLFLTNMIVPAKMSWAQSGGLAALNLPVPGAMVHPTEAYMPAMVRGMEIHPDNPLKFNFIIDKGESGLSFGSEAFRQESKSLVKYFLAALTVPENEQWVNLSPYEKDRITGEGLGKTEMGRDMLAQDYILKQLTASLIYPQDDLGKEFWQKVYAEAKAKFGITDLPLNTFNKVWIMPDKSMVYEKGNQVFVIEQHLKVMLEQDYMALRDGQDKASSDSVKGSDQDVNNVMSDCVRTVVVPAIEREVNSGRNFARLRQIYNSMILAVWYKKTLRESLLGKIYMDQNRSTGVEVDDPKIRFEIYEQYLASFKAGVYNYIKEEVDPATREISPKKYVSGGIVTLKSADLAQATDQQAETWGRGIGNNRAANVEVDLSPTKSAAAANRVVTDNAQDLTRVSPELKPYVISDQLSKYLRNSVRTAVMLTLGGKPVGGLSRLRSYVKAATGQESGYYVAWDWGGTNLRVLLVHLQPGKDPIILDKYTQKVEFPKDFISGKVPNDKVNDFVAGKVAALLAMVKADPQADPEILRNKLKLGAGFSFPTKLLASNQAKLTNNNVKGWAFPGLSIEEVGDAVAPDIIALQQAAIDRDPELKGKVEIRTLPNDTIALALAVAGVIALIDGTGANMAVKDPSTGELINLEFGAFNAIPAPMWTPLDQQVFNDVDPGVHQWEKMISGKYLIELLKRHMQKYYPESKSLKSLFSVKDLDSRVLSLAADPDLTDGARNMELHTKYGFDAVITSDAWAELAEPSRVLLVRAGKILGASLAGTLEVVDPGNVIKLPVIAYDGSVINNPIVLATAKAEIKRLTGREVVFKTIQDATAIGTAVSAAVEPIDAAMAKGGIDLNAATMDMQIRRDGKGVPLPMTQQPWANIRVSGFEPVIGSVVPVSIPALLVLQN